MANMLRNGFQHLTIEELITRGQSAVEKALIHREAGDVWMSRIWYDVAVDYQTEAIRRGHGDQVSEQLVLFTASSADSR